ncbi:MAG: ABC transporter ATP-binding protein, partial [Clostridia bacterium]|nr:ABC transporter ATP-binding protein [Clostridia bacterium]
MKKSKEPDTAQTTRAKRDVDKDRKPQIKFWATLLPYMKPYRRHIILAVLFSMITGFCVAVQPLVIKYIVDSGIGGEAITLFGQKIYTVPDDIGAKTRFIVIAAAIYVALSVFRITSWGGGLANMVRALEGTLFTLRSRFFGHVQRMCLRFYDKNSSGELYNYIMGSPMNNIKTYLHSMIQSVPYQAVSLVISLAALLSYSWQLTLLLLLTALVMALLNRHSRKRIRRETQSFLQAEKETSHYITDILHGSEAIKMYSIEDATVERFEGYIDNLKRRDIHYNMSLFLEHLKPELTQYIGIASVYLLGGILCLNGKVTTGMLYAFLSSMGTILGTVSSWLNISLSKNSATVALERVKQIIDEHSTTPEVADSSRRSLQIEKESAIR